MADKLLYENLPVALRDRGETYELGVVIEGGFFAFGAFKAGGFNVDLEEARVAAQQQHDEQQRQQALAEQQQREAAQQQQQ